VDITVNLMHRVVVGTPHHKVHNNSVAVGTTHHKVRHNNSVKHEAVAEGHSEATRALGSSKEFLVESVVQLVQ
jgi:hypothetical protein